MTLINTEDGVRLFVREDGRRDLPALLLAHALGADHGMWDAQLDTLSARFHLIRYDARGHGRSDAPVGDYTLDRLGRDALNVLDALMIREAAFVGLSMGGVVGQWLGFHGRGRISRLVLASTAPYLGGPAAWADRIDTARRDGVAPLVDAILARWFTPTFRATRAGEVERVRRMLLACPPAGYAGCAAALAATDLRPHLADIELPTLVVAGTGDPSGAVDSARLIAGAVAGARTLEFEAAHLLNIEQADAFSGSVIDFLEA